MLRAYLQAFNGRHVFNASRRSDPFSALPRFRCLSPSPIIAVSSFSLFCTHGDLPGLRSTYRIKAIECINSRRMQSHEQYLHVHARGWIDANMSKLKIILRPSLLQAASTGIKGRAVLRFQLS